VGASMIAIAAAQQPGAPPGFGNADRGNALTAKEAADGWLLLFDGETPLGWSPSLVGKLLVKDGTLRVDGRCTLQHSTAFHEFALEFRCRVTGAIKHDDAQLQFGGESFSITLPKAKNPVWATAKLIVADKKFKFSVNSDVAGFGGGGQLKNA